MLRPNLYTILNGNMALVVYGHPSKAQAARSSPSSKVQVRNTPDPERQLCVKDKEQSTTGKMQFDWPRFGYTFVRSEHTTISSTLYAGIPIWVAVPRSHKTRDNAGRIGRLHLRTQYTEID